MGLGHPILLPGGQTRLGLFPGSLLSPHSPPRPGLASPATLLPVSLAGRSWGLPLEPRLLTHLLGEHLSSSG
jgi:hypothetical protein